MAVQAVPAYLQNASHSAALFRQAMSNPYSGAGVLGSGEFAVGAQGTPNMSVLVGAGRAKVAGSQISAPTLLSGATATFTTQAMYDVLNDASVTLTISTADPTNPRIDTVYVAVQDSYYSGANNQAALGVVTGTPAPTPVASAAPSNSLVLGYVAVAANAASIVAANITQASTFAAILAPTQGLTLVNPASVVGGTVSALGGVSFASASAVSLNGVFTSQFDNYRVVLKFAPSSTGVPLLRLRAGGSDDTSTNYGYQLIASSSGSVSAAVNDNSTSFELTSATASSKFFGFVDVFSPFLADPTGFLADIQSYSSISSATGMAWEKSSGAHGPAVSKDGFTLYTGVGAMTGTLRVYGYNNG